MSITLIVGGSITKTSRKDTIIEVLDGSFNSYAGKQNIWEAGERTNYKAYVAPEKKPVEVDEFKHFPTGWWSTDVEGKKRVEYDTLDKKGYRAQLEDTVYFHLNVNKIIPVDTQIKFKLWDRDVTDHEWTAFIGVVLPFVLARDDDDFGKNGKELFVTGTVKDVGEEHNRITLKLFLSPEWRTQLEADKGSFKDGCLDFLWSWQYENHKYTSANIILSVYYDRNLFIKEAYPSKYKFPEVIDSETGDFIVFLKNEAGDVVGDINSTIDHFYAVRITVKADYSFSGRSNEVVKKLYEEKINLHTGKSSTKKLFEVKELVAFKANKTKTTTYLKNTTVTKIRKKFSDYYNVYDIGNYGLKGLQEAMNVLGYIDLFNDLSDAIAGKGLSTYDTNGVMIATAEEATKVAIAQETKLGIMTAEEIAMMSLPEWINPVTFGLAVFEETISKPFVAQVMQDIADTMFMRMELAKRGGLEAVKLLLDLDNNTAQYYELIYNIPQQKHDEVFAGKIKTHEELKKDNDLYFSINPRAKAYTYLLALIETDEAEVNDYNIDTIFI
jgi:hypothetical protein